VGQAGWPEFGKRNIAGRVCNCGGWQERPFLPLKFWKKRPFIVNLIAQRVYQIEHLRVARDILHTVAVMDKSGYASFVYQHLGGHPAKLEDFDLLPVQFQDSVFGIGQASEWQAVFAKIFSKRFLVFGAEDENGRIPFYKFIMVLTQLRHMLLAKRSHKPPVKDQQHMLLPLKLGE
jgi:hypothetical protein